MKTRQNLKTNHDVSWTKLNSQQKQNKNKKEKVKKLLLYNSDDDNDDNDDDDADDDVYVYFGDPDLNWVSFATSCHSRKWQNKKKKKNTENNKTICG